MAILLVLIGGIAYLTLRPAGRSAQDSFVYVTDTTTYEHTVDRLIADLQIKSPALLRTAGRLLQVEDKLRPGRYHVSPEMNLWQLCKVLAYGGQTPVKLVFSSVRTQEELIDKLSSPLAMNASALRQLLQDSAYCASLGFDTATIRCMFLPDTHEVYWDITPEELIKKYLRSYQTFWSQERNAKARKIGLTPVEVSIIASIIEEESSKKDEYGDIAGLYINRLRKGMPLQADPTLKYACGDFSIRRIGGALLLTDSPYNTYKYRGLPPGPIRYPQMDTIDRVLDHKEHNYLYMCARADFSGYHQFAASYYEHARNARAYQKALDDRNISS